VVDTHLMQDAEISGVDYQQGTLPGDRALERRLKVQGGASRRCPLCGVVPRPGPLPRNCDGRVSRSLTSDEQKDAAGLMTAGQLAEHTALRYGALSGKLSRPASRGPVPPDDDPWALPLPAFTRGGPAVTAATEAPADGKAGMDLPGYGRRRRPA
jgi:hypothetical protein